MTKKVQRICRGMEMETELFIFFALLFFFLSSFSVRRLEKELQRSQNHLAAAGLGPLPAPSSAPFSSSASSSSSSSSSSLPIDPVSVAENALSDLLPPWQAEARFMSPLLVAYEQRIQELEEENAQMKVWQDRDRNEERLASEEGTTTFSCV